ncbi:hypothetical protein ACA910_018639 [Epithemia clementina (nom. ined.)]
MTLFRLIVVQRGALLRRPLNTSFLLVQPQLLIRSYGTHNTKNHPIGRRLSSGASLMSEDEDHEDHEDHSSMRHHHEEESQEESPRPFHPLINPADMGHHYETPDDSSCSPYQLSYTLPPIQLDALPSRLSNFFTAKQWFERLVLSGNEETKQVYVDANALQMFDAIFPEIGQSRQIGRIKQQHFETWDYSTNQEHIQMEKAFSLLLQHSSEQIRDQQQGRGQNTTRTSPKNVVDRQGFKAFIKRMCSKQGNTKNESLTKSSDENRRYGNLFDRIDQDCKGHITLEDFRNFWFNQGTDDRSKHSNVNGNSNFYQSQRGEMMYSTSFSKKKDKEHQKMHDMKVEEHDEAAKVRAFLADLAMPLVANNVEVMLQPDDLTVDGHVNLLAVGGPSSYTAALLHKAQYPKESILHVVKHRLDSNADGSAYYYHERDAFPLYINKVNTGWYCVYADLHKRFRSKESLRDLCIHDRHHVKIAINWGNVLRNPWIVASIFIPNTWHAFQDLVLRQPKDSLMQQACLHSQRVPKIIDKVCEALGLPPRAFLIRDPDRAVYIGLKGTSEQASKHFDWLNEYANIPYHHLDKPENFSNLVHEALAFDRDGALNPFMFENFQRAFEKVGIEYRQGWVLNRIFVKPDAKETHRLVGTAAEFVNCTTGEVKVMSFDKMTFSLGPSGTVVLNQNAAAKSSPSKQQKRKDSKVSPNNSNQSVLRDSLNRLQGTLTRGNLLYKDTMWAAGSSSVCIIGIKRGTVTGKKLDVFRKFIDGVNQHWTLIKEREVHVGHGPDHARVYDFFCIQMTGGGNFPSRHTKPDFVLNLLYTTEAVFGLNNLESSSSASSDAVQPGDIIFDIVQTRGCGRSVSARNTVGFSPIAKNVVSAYGLGGIGMTTAFSNGALQLQVLEALSGGNGDQELLSPNGACRGQIGITPLSQRTLKEFFGENIFQGVNYQAMIDDPQTVARGLGVDTSLSSKEKRWMVTSALLASATAAAPYLALLSAGSW